MLVGPSTRFHDYEQWSKQQLYGARSQPPAGRFVEALREVGIAVISLALMVYGASFDYLRLADHADSVYSWTLWQRILFIQGCGVVARFRYYGVWSLSNASCILSGLAFNGVDPKTGVASWTRCKNVFVHRLECSHNWKELLDAWNSNTNVWLRECVYKRLAGSRKPGFSAVMGTFVASAIWHGIAPGYYCTWHLLTQSLLCLRVYASGLRDFSARRCAPSFSRTRAARTLRGRHGRSTRSRSTCTRCCRFW